jgi:hypothetical protein
MTEIISLSEAVKTVWPEFSERYDQIMGQWQSPYSYDKKEAVNRMANLSNGLLKIVNAQLKMAVILGEGLVGLKAGQIKMLEGLKELEPKTTLSGKKVDEQKLHESRERLSYMLGFCEGIIHNWANQLETDDLGTGLDNRLAIVLAVSRKYDEMLADWREHYEPFCN